MCERQPTLDEALQAISSARRQVEQPFPDPKKCNFGTQYAETLRDFVVASDLSPKQLLQTILGGMGDNENYANCLLTLDMKVEVKEKPRVKVELNNVEEGDDDILTDEDEDADYNSTEDTSS